MRQKRLPKGRLLSQPSYLVTQYHSEWLSRHGAPPRNGVRFPVNNSYELALFVTTMIDGQTYTSPVPSPGWRTHRMRFGSISRSFPEQRAVMGKTRGSNGWGFATKSVGFNTVEPLGVTMMQFAKKIGSFNHESH